MPHASRLATLAILSLLLGGCATAQALLQCLLVDVSSSCGEGQKLQRVVGEQQQQRGQQGDQAQRRGSGTALHSCRGMVTVSRRPSTRISTTISQ